MAVFSVIFYFISCCWKPNICNSFGLSDLTQWYTFPCMGSCKVSCSLIPNQTLAPRNILVHFLAFLYVWGGTLWRSWGEWTWASSFFSFTSSPLDPPPSQACSLQKLGPWCIAYSWNPLHGALSQTRQTEDQPFKKISSIYFKKSSFLLSVIVVVLPVNIEFTGSPALSSCEIALGWLFLVGWLEYCIVAKLCSWVCHITHFGWKKGLFSFGTYEARHIFTYTLASEQELLWIGLASWHDREPGPPPLLAHGDFSAALLWCIHISSSLRLKCVSGIFILYQGTECEPQSCVIR